MALRRWAAGPEGPWLPELLQKIITCYGTVGAARMVAGVTSLRHRAATITEGQGVRTTTITCWRRPNHSFLRIRSTVSQVRVVMSLPKVDSNQLMKSGVVEPVVSVDAKTTLADAS